MLHVRDFLRDQTILGTRSSESTPLVSVVLPTFQRCASGLLERSIRSVLAQTFTDFELLVMDDGSNDGSNELIERLRAGDPRLIHVRHEQNCGLPGLRVNQGIELARGRYLAFQFDDDVWRPNALADLLAEIERHREPVVVVGKAHFTMHIGHVDLPEVEVDTRTLYERNRFANNSVMLAKQLLERHGMYDPHVGMRRLCDWDLWLRLVRHARFVVIDAIVSDVFEGTSGSIGTTVPYDVALFRLMSSISRDHLLTPERWRDYRIDGTRIGELEIAGELGRRLYEEQIAPYYSRFRHFAPAVEGFPATQPPAQPGLLVYTKETYEISNDVLITNFDAAMTERRSYKAMYQPAKEMTSDVVEQADVLLLMRTVEEDAARLLDTALEVDTPVGYCMDDDLLTFHELGPQFAYLAPGTPYHRSVTRQVERADAVVVTSAFIADSARPLNPRIVMDNGAIPRQYLPRAIPARNPSDPVRIGYVGSGYRIEEFEVIWDALRRIAEERRDGVIFEFWGLDVGSLPPLAARVVQKGFQFNYYGYLEALGAARFDVLLTPLLDHPRPRLAKARIKYYETAVAGALGVFSDVPQYRTLPGGLTCLKARNEPEEWYRTLRAALDLPARERDVMRARCLEHVREEFTVEGQLHHHESAIRAVQFHGWTRDRRHEDGRPRILYAFHSPFMGGAEIQHWRRLSAARAAGVEPIVLLPRSCEGTEDERRLRQTLEREGIQLELAAYSCFTEPRSPADFRDDSERGEVKAVLERCRPALVHSLTFVPTIGQVTHELGLPHVASLYQVDDEVRDAQEPPGSHCTLVHSDSARFASRWSHLLGGVAKACSRGMAPETLFDLGLRRSLERGSEPATTERDRPLRIVMTGTFQERKRQLETIRAAALVRREAERPFHLELRGYTQFFPAYVASCRDAIGAGGLDDCVAIEDFTPDLTGVLADADVLLTLSTHESLPTSIAEAMAAGVLVVATPVGGIPEIVIDGVSGILCCDTSVEGLAAGIQRALRLPACDRARIVEQARRVARSEFHPFRIANDLFEAYNRAFDLHRGPSRRSSFVSAPAWRGRAPQAPENAPSRAPASSERVGAKLVYDYEPRSASWNGVDVMVGTHMRPATGRLALRVVSPTGRVLREAALDLATARDNDWLRYRFPPIRNSRGRRFRLEFGLRHAGPRTQLSLYQVSPPVSRHLRAVRGIARRLALPLRGSELYARESASGVRSHSHP